MNSGLVRVYKDIRCGMSWMEDVFAKRPLNNSNSTSKKKIIKKKVKIFFTPYKFIELSF